MVTLGTPHLLMHSTSSWPSKGGRQAREAVRFILMFVLEMEVVGVVDGGGGPPPGHVVHGPEESDLAVHPPVGLHTLEQLLGVVEHLVTGSEQLVTKKALGGQ